MTKASYLRGGLLASRHSDAEHGTPPSTIVCQSAVEFGGEEREPADWLGFHINSSEQGLKLTIHEQAWQRLEEKLTHAHQEPNAFLHAKSIICGWVDQMGPCYPHIDLVSACERITAIAHALAFDEIPAIEKLRQDWQRAFARWCKRRDKVLAENWKTEMPAHSE